MRPWKLLGRLLILPAAAFLVTSLPPGIDRDDWVLQMHTDTGLDIVLRISDDPGICRIVRQHPIVMPIYVTYSCSTDCLEQKDGGVWCRRQS